MGVRRGEYGRLVEEPERLLVRRRLALEDISMNGKEVG
jgi:hypothetical protein